MTTLATLFAPAQRQRLLAAIPKRYSCRSFSAAPTPADWASLSYAAQRYALPGARLILRSVSPDIFTGIVLGVGKITGCTTAAAVVTSLGEPHGRVNAGILGEAFCLEATALGLGTCWVSGTYKRKLLDLPLQPDEAVLAVIALGVPAKSDPPENRRRKSLSRLCKGDLSLWPQEFQQAAVAVQAAPSAMNLQPWEMLLEDGSLALTVPLRQSLDLGIAACHAELALSHPHQWAFADGAALCTPAGVPTKKIIP